MKVGDRVRVIDDGLHENTWNLIQLKKITVGKTGIIRAFGPETINVLLDLDGGNGTLVYIPREWILLERNGLDVVLGLLGSIPAKEYE